MISHDDHKTHDSINHKWYFEKIILAKLQDVAPWGQSKQNALVFWVCLYFEFSFWFIFLRSLPGKTEKPYIAIL